MGEAARARFDLVLIDHGFHCHATYEVRQTWCKLWKALGFCDEALLKEAAAEINVTGDTYKLLPTMLMGVEYESWRERSFGVPALETFQRIGEKAVLVTKDIFPVIPRQLHMV